MLERFHKPLGYLLLFYPFGSNFQNVSSSIFCGEKRNKKCIENLFNDDFSVIDTIFCAKSFELPKNYH